MWSKRKMAIKMMSREEIKNHVSIFLSKAWSNRNYQRKIKEISKSMFKKKKLINR